MTAIILAGGPLKGLEIITRSARSRSMLPILDSTLLDYILNALLPELNPREIIVVSEDPSVAELCARRGCHFVSQRGAGIEAALCSALSEAPVKGALLLVFADVFAEKEFYRICLDKLSTEEYVSTVVAAQYVKPGYLKMDVDYVDMMVEEVGGGEHVFAGLAVLPVEKTLEVVCKQGRQLRDLLALLARRGKLGAVVWAGAWVDIDTPWDYLIANVLALNSMIRESIISSKASVANTAVIEGPVYVAPGARVDHYAVIKGPAFIGPRTLIGAHAFVREFTAVYTEGVVGAHSEVKRSVIMPKAVISSYCYIADSVIGEGAEIAPYTVTLNVPLKEVPPEVRVSAAIPLEKIKIGAVVHHSTRTSPFQALEPGTIY